MQDILLIHATVITMDKERRILSDAAVAVKDGKITEIGPSADLKEKYTATQLLDCRGKIVLPGLINCHSHAGHCIMGKLESDTMNRWWSMMMQAYENAADERFWHADGQLHACAAIRGGITTSVNVLGSTPMGDCPEYARAHASGFAGVGAREILGMGVPYDESYPKPYTRYQNGKPVPRMVSVEEMLAGTEEALRTIHNAYEGRIRVFVTPHQQLMGHTPGEKNPALLTQLTPFERDLNRRVRELARKYHTQVYTDTYGSWIPLAYTDKENMLLGEDVLIGMEHVAATNFRELQILAETGTKVYYTSEGLYRRVPVSELMQMGIPLGITTNGCAPRTTLDLLEALRRAILAERIFHDDRCYFDAHRALECVTIGAAKCLGLEDQIGSLEAGKRADIAVLDASRPDLLPLGSPVERIVYNAAGGDFSTVIAEGKVLLHEGRIQQVNEEEVLREADEVHRQIVQDCHLEDYAEKPIFGKVRMDWL